MKRQYLPVVLTSFVNKCGDIGLSLLPVLLVELQLSTKDSAWIMGLAKSGTLVGTVVGGVLSDLMGLKRTVVFSFALSGLSLGLIPYSMPWFGIVGLAILSFVASFAGTLYKGPNRILVVSLAGHHERQEAIGWLRAANNLGMILGYSIAAVGKGLGLHLLFLFDSFTAWAAAAFGVKVIPSQSASVFKRKSSTQSQNALPGESRQKVEPWIWPFVGISLIMMSYGFLYDLFMVGGAAKTKMIFGEEGVSFFARMMLVNTVICAILAVPAAKILKNVRFAMIAGFICLVSGLLVTVHSFETVSKIGLLLGAFVVTTGEIFLSAVGQLSLIRYTPAIRAANTLYSISMAVQYAGRVLSAVVSYHWIVEGNHAMAGPLVIGVVTLGLVALLYPYLSSAKINETA